MTALRTAILAGAALAFATAQPAGASPAPNAKLWSGTWKLNIAKSKFSSTEYAARSETRTYVVSGNRVRMNSNLTPSSGKAMKWSYSAAWDGKAYPTSGNPNADHIILMPVSDREVKSRSMLHGKPSATSTATVSADGKQIMLTRSILTAKSGPTNDTLVFDRVH